MNPNSTPSSTPAVTKPLFPVGNVATVLQSSAPSERIKPAMVLVGEFLPETEIVERRSETSKHFPTGNPNEFQTVVSPAAVHYKDANGVYQEIDLTIQKDKNLNLVVNKAPYQLQIFTDKVGYRLTQPDGTWFTIELIEIGGVPVDNSQLIIKQDTIQVFYSGLAKGIEQKLLLFATQPDIYTQLTDDSAPKVFTWFVTQNGTFSFTSSGGDMNQDSLEVITTQQPVDATSFTYTENFTGRVSRKQPKTRIKQWFNDPVYPVILDPTVTLGITNIADVGREFQSYAGWTNGRPWLGWSISRGNENAGWRFRNIGIPTTGATITSAFLKWTTHAVSNVHAAKVYGDKVGNAVGWDNLHRPSQITKTTSSTTFTPVGSGVVNTINVGAQVAEIVALGSWASLNAMRFGGFATFVGGTWVAYGYQYSTAPSKTGTLIITYTTGGGGGGSSPVPPARTIRHR